MKKINKEVKFVLQDCNIIEKLRENKAVLVGGTREKTIRYDDPNSTYEKKGQFIRVRTGFNNILSLKEKLDDDNSKVFRRREIEIEVDDIDNIDYLLKSLGLKQVGIMEKYRLKWSYKGNTINLDELPFGLFLEIHGEETEIFKIINEFEIDKKDMFVGTYWDIFDTYKKENKLKPKETNIMFSEGYSYLLAKF